MPSPCSPDQARTLIDAGALRRDDAVPAAGAAAAFRAALGPSPNGPAGTAWPCHSVLVHATQPHRGMRPRLVA